MENSSQEIAVKIYRANPGGITFDILNLLYKYVLARLEEDYSSEKMAAQVKNDEVFIALLSSINYDSLKKSE